MFASLCSNMRGHTWRVVGLIRQAHVGSVGEGSVEDETSEHHNRKRERISLDWCRFNAVLVLGHHGLQSGSSGHCTIKKGMGSGGLPHLHHGHVLPLFLLYPNNSPPTALPLSFVLATCNSTLSQSVLLNLWD